jgi:hypothetical protein
VIQNPIFTDMLANANIAGDAMMMRGGAASIFLVTESRHAPMMRDVKSPCVVNNAQPLLIELSACGNMPGTWRTAPPHQGQDRESEDAQN